MIDRLTVAAMCVVASLCLWFLLGLLVNIHDWIACWRSPESMVDVNHLVVLDRRVRLGEYDKIQTALPRFEGQSANEAWHILANGAIDHHGVERDFNGDGAPDALEISYYHMEPIFRETTSGMVLVESGSTGEVLLGYATPTPFDHVYWCGDVDGNGTDDVLIENDNQAVVLGHEGPGG